MSLSVWFLCWDDWVKKRMIAFSCGAILTSMDASSMGGGGGDDDDGGVLEDDEDESLD